MRNQLQTYYLPEDEKALSVKLRQLASSIFFIDHDEAESSDVRVHSELGARKSRFAYIFDAETSDSAIATARWKELVRTKTGDNALAQFLPSRLTTERLDDGKNVELLLSGRVAIMGSGTPKQQAFKKIVYKAVSQMSTPEIFPVSPTTREFLGPKQLGSRVGYHALEWCKDDSHLLRHVATRLLYGLPMVE